MVTTDQIREVMDHSAMLSRLTELTEQGSPVGVIVFDLDSFDAVNRTGGREAGDRVIINTSKGAAGLVAELGGSCYRVSGDEFCVLLPGASLEQTFLQGERLRKWADDNQEVICPPEGMKVTVSVGVAHYPRNGKSPEEVLRAASAAMVSAKEAGRNQVSLPPSEEMVMKSCYYPATSLSMLKQLAAKVKKSESELLREALDNLLRKYDD
jgi:diguanylate cyclase